MRGNKIKMAEKAVMRSKDNAIIIQHIVYSTRRGPAYTIQDPSLASRDVDIACTSSGEITSSDTKLRSYIMYTGPLSVLYNIHIYVDTALL
jgi:hypothetical protein